MKKSISSMATIFYKFVVPGFIAFQYLQPIKIPEASAAKSSLASNLAFTASAFVIFAIVYFLVMRLKKVEVDEEYIYVSNYFRNEKISIGQIAKIREWNNVINLREVTVFFKTRTGFGDRIIFVPRGTIFGVLSPPSPFVKELRSKIV
jgi:hypothetical protein